MPATELDDKVAQIVSWVAQYKGSNRRTSFVHLLTPGLAKEVQKVAKDITYREVDILLGRLRAGDADAATALLMKFFPVAVPALRNLDSNTRVSSTPNKSGKRTTTFTYDDFRTLSLERADVMDEAALILLNLLRGYDPGKGNPLSPLPLANYLKRYFSARFATYVRNTMLFSEGGRRKAKIQRVSLGDLSENMVTAREEFKSAPVRNFADYMQRAEVSRGLLYRDLTKYMGNTLHPRSKTADWVKAALDRGWRLEPMIWRRAALPEPPSTTAPLGGKIVFYVMRDGFLDEFLRTKDAKKHLPALVRGRLGKCQIAVFNATYGEHRLTDAELAVQQSKSREAIRKARSRAVEIVVQEALKEYQTHLELEDS